MTPLRSQMIKAMRMRGFSPRTHASYLAAVTDLARYTHRSPAELKVSDVETYFEYLVIERQLSGASCRLFLNGIRFLYLQVLKRPEFDVEVVITSSDDAISMLPYAQQLVQAAEESGLFLFADTDLRVDLTQVKINLDKQQLADLGMSVSDVANQVGLLNSEGYVTRYDDRGRAYFVVLVLGKFQ